MVFQLKNVLSIFLLNLVQTNSSPNSSSSSNENSPQQQPVTIQTQSGQTLQLIPQQLTLGSKGYYTLSVTNAFSN